MCIRADARLPFLVRIWVRVPSSKFTFTIYRMYLCSRFHSGNARSRCLARMSVRELSIGFIERKHVNVFIERMNACFFFLAQTIMCFELCERKLMFIERRHVCAPSIEDTLAFSSGQCTFLFNFANARSRLIVRKARSRVLVHTALSRFIVQMHVCV